MSNHNKKRKNTIIDDKVPTQDQLIVDYIKDQLEEKMQASAMDINLFCKDGYVHMSGMVDVLAEKKLAEEIAMEIPGVRKIENKITVAMDGNITDKHIEKEVIRNLRSAEIEEKIAGVGVKVQDGVVNLVGRTHTLLDAHKAMNLAAQARGVKDVVNNVEIDTVGQYTDIDISNKIIQEYSKVPLEYKDIHREVIGGVVTLDGFLNNKAEVEIAKEIAMGIEGVKKVRVHLRTRE